MEATARTSSGVDAQTPSDGADDSMDRSTSSTVVAFARETSMSMVLPIDVTVSRTCMPTRSVAIDEIQSNWTAPAER